MESHLGTNEDAAQPEMRASPLMVDTHRIKTILNSTPLCSIARSRSIILLREIERVALTSKP